jgi:alpha-L-fucosidase
MKRPPNGLALIKTLYQGGEKQNPNFNGIIKDVSVLGEENAPAFERMEDGLHVHFDKKESNLPVVIKITLE